MHWKAAMVDKATCHSSLRSVFCHEGRLSVEEKTNPPQREACLFELKKVKALSPIAPQRRWMDITDRLK